MKLTTDCLICTVGKMNRLYAELGGAKEQELSFMKEIYSIASGAQPDDTAPLVSARMLRVLLARTKQTDPYARLKTQSNKSLLVREEELFSRIMESQDPLQSGLRHAMIGNFIDFGAMDRVDEAQLARLIESAQDTPVDQATVDRFRTELEAASRFVCLGDNAGEIVFDKILLRTLHALYPDLQLTHVVRGRPVFNDATEEDARQVGLDQVAKVVSNGTDIPGTQLDCISTEAIRAIDEADIVLAKGQGNFESLAGCGRDLYYLFLCKCDLFAERFGLNRFDGVFIHEEALEKAITEDCLAGHKSATSKG